jgi:predicted nuclease of predicted toxin-antitoxin system
VRLLLDENCGSRRLAALQRSAGHVVETVVDALGAGSADTAVLHYAARHGCVLVTKDADDFRTAGTTLKRTPGILVIYEDAKRSPLRYEAIARAVGNVEATYEDVDGLVLALNEFTW